MKILKLLNKKNTLFFLFFILFTSSIANEPADIWNIEKSKIETDEKKENESLLSEDISEEKISVYDLNNQNNENRNQNLRYIQISHTLSFLILR